MIDEQRRAALAAAFGCPVKGQRPVKIHRQNAGELVTCGIFAHGIDGVAEAGIVAFFAHKAVGLALDRKVLLGSDVVLKREQRVRVGLQQARKDRDQRDVGIARPAFPLVHCGRRNAQAQCHLLLRHAEFEAFRANDVVDFHGCPFDQKHFGRRAAPLFDQMSKRLAIE